MALFPDPETADEIGLVAVGGNLSTRRLLEAYRSGIFPWFDEGDPVLWWSPDPRTIFELGGFHISRRLGRTIRSGRFEVTINAAFNKVIRGCADREEGTWVTQNMVRAYIRLHRLGWAHSVETWYDGKLAGGIYGVAIGGFFAGESMFYRQPDASKVALAHLVDHLRGRGFELFDIQMPTDHTRSLGAIEIPRKTYLRRLKKAIDKDVRFE